MQIVTAALLYKLSANTVPMIHSGNIMYVADDLKDIYVYLPYGLYLPFIY